MPYRLMRVALRVARSCPTNPAACQVVPQVSLPCSSSTTSVTPSRVRWYAAEAPAMPPPTITTRASATRREGVELDSGAALMRRSEGRACSAELERGDAEHDAGGTGEPRQPEA